MLPSMRWKESNCGHGAVYKMTNGFQKAQSSLSHSTGTGLPFVGDMGLEVITSGGQFVRCLTCACFSGQNLSMVSY
jgi:hypothetical protein